MPWSDGESTETQVGKQAMLKDVYIVLCLHSSKNIEYEYTIS